MALDSTTKAIATKAWSQLMHSVISDDPPSDMSREYYYARPLSIERFQRSLKHTGVDKFQLGAENLQPRKTFHPIVEKVNSMKYSQEIRRFEDQREGDKYLEGIKNIQYARRITRTMDNEVVQINEDRYQQGIDHIEYAMRSIADGEVVQENEDIYQQEIDYNQYAIRSLEDVKMVEENEFRHQQGIDHIQYGMRSIPDNEVAQENEDRYEQGIDHIQYAIRSIVDDKLVQENEYRYQQGIDHIQYAIGSIADHEVVQENKYKYQLGIDHIKHAMKTTDNEVVQANEDNYQHETDYIQCFKRTTVDDETEYELEVLSILRDSLDHVEDRIWKENSTLRSEVLEAYELIKGGVDAIGGEMDEKHPTVLYQKKRLELILRICDIETSERTVCKYIGDGGGDQYCKQCEVLQTVKDESQRGIRQAQAIIVLFDELLKLVEKGFILRKKKPQVKVLKLIKVLHHYGVDAVRSEVTEELEKLNEMYDGTIKNSTIEYKKKALEVMLRICETETCQKIISEIILQAKREHIWNI